MKSICMKRVPGINLGYILVFFIPWMTTFLSVDAQVRLECAEVTYLEVGKEGVVICSSEDFYAVTWYTKEDYDANKNGLIHLNGNKHGLTAEYDVYPNGSFMIRNVTFNHSGRYVVTLLRDVTSNLVVHEVRVEVYVIPDPPYPVVEGHIHQQHVYMDVNRDGELSCSMRGVYPNVSLTWTVLDPSQSNKIQFQHDVIGKMQNEDKTYDITRSSMFRVTDPSIRRITIQCGVANEIGEYLSAKTKVDLLFFAVYPVVNGHVNQKHVYSDVERKGCLTCLKENVDVGTRLVWELPNPSMRDKITFQSNTVISNNIDGTVNINQTFDYEVNDNSLERITVECKEMEPDTDPLATRVDLLFQKVYPVVNGHVNQKHVYLDVEREGYLTCMKENVDVGTRLVWELLDPSMRDTISFQGNAVISNNNDGTVNINQTCHYIVHDVTLERIAIKCSMIEPDTEKLPHVTRVELLLSDVAVIDGCYSQKDYCAVEVERTGKLTCTIKNIHYPVDLQWSVLDGDPNSLVFEDGSPSVQNNTNLFDISLTAPYTVFEDSVKQVIVQCDARRSDSGLLISIARASLVIQNNAGDSSHGTVVVLSCAIIFLVIALGLIVSILWYCNRKMYKKSEMKYLGLLGCRNNGNGYHIPEEVTMDQITSHTTAAGSPARCSVELDARNEPVELDARNEPQGAKRDKSSDSPDSGNSGSNSRERSGSEASEKSGLMRDTATSCGYDKQGSMDGKRGCSEGDSMV